MLVVAQLDVVGHIHLAWRQLLLYHGVTTVGYLNVEAVIDHWAVVAVFNSHSCKGEKAVKLGQQAGIALDSWDVIANSCN